MYKVRFLFKKVILIVALLLSFSGKAANYIGINDYIDSSVATPGVWNVNFSDSLSYATKNHVPVLMYYGSTGCGYCSTMAEAINLPKFRQWMEEHPIILIYKHLTPAEISEVLNAKSAEKCKYPDVYLSREWVKDTSASIPDYPRLRIWWEEENGTVHNDSFCGRAQSMPVKKPSGSTAADLCEKLIASLEMYVGSYVPKPAYVGGYFATTNTPYASLEAERTTKSVNVEIVRTATDATNQNMIVSYPSGTKGAAMVAVTNIIQWSANQVCQTNRLSNFDKMYFAEGRKVTLQLLNDEGEVMSETVIRCSTPKNSAGNPDWLECADFGVWTMDLEAAKAKTHKTAGKAYTLVAVQGSLWCPDCSNTEENFLNVEDKDGNNLFAAWAKKHNVALVSVDVPNYKAQHLGMRGPDGKPINDPYMSYETFDQDIDTPCLLSRAAFTGNKGAELRSGLGYLTRKGISDADARRIWERNWNLVWKNTSEGGFHRPEDANKNRTGVPIFVLLDKDGIVRARLTRMASVSPSVSDRSKFDDYLKRFDEMLWIADNNETEIENNYPSAGSVVFKANGGSESATISHTDLVDTFFLDGVGGNALQRIRIEGESDAEVKVAYYSTNELGVAVQQGEAVVGKLSEGVELLQIFEQGGSYFVQIEANDPTSAAFAIDSPVENHFTSYKISGTMIAVPQEDRAVARPPIGSDVVVMRLQKMDDAGLPVVYRIEGMTEGGCEKLTSVPGTSLFFTATATGDFPITLEQVDGSLTYQIWKPGTVGFDKTSRSVKESVCDLDGKPLEIKLTRTGGKSGEITVKVDTNLVAIADYRYDFTPTNVVWRDGDMSDKIVYLMVNNDLLYDGKGVIELAMTITRSTAGDAKIADGKGTFTLTVAEDDVQAPGKAYITRAEPEYNAKRVVYARESEGMKFYAKRIDGNDGLVAAILTSSVKGTVFTTEDPRDLEDIAQDYPELKDLVPEGAKFLYWSTREDKEKYVQVTGIPAGKTATIRFSPVSPLGTVSASNTVTIVSIADDAPGFAEVLPMSFYRTVDESYAVGVTGVREGDAVSFLKISGTLPAGLKVSYDAANTNFVIAGTATAKPGIYESVYQVRVRRGGTLIPGLAAAFKIVVADPAAEGPGGEPPLNPAVAKSRSFGDLMVIDETTGRLTGLVQLTIPATGRLSAKYTCSAGTVSFSSRSWGGVSGESGCLTAELAASKKGYAMVVEAFADERVRVQVTDPDFGDELFAETDGTIWSKDSPATAWDGYYTVAVTPNRLISEDTVGVAPTSYGYLTLKMNTAANVRKGSFTIAGMLPNGTKISGSSILSGSGCLPIFKKSSKDLFTAVAEILPYSVVEANHRGVALADGCEAYWEHTEKSTLKGSYAMSVKLYGGYFKTEDLLSCCEEAYKQSNLNFYVNGLAPVPVIVADKPNWINPSAENPGKLTFVYNRLTGVVTGSFLIDGMRWNYGGIVVNGWGDCGCGGEGVIYLPLMSGSAYRTDSATRLTLSTGVEVDK